MERVDVVEQIVFERQLADRRRAAERDPEPSEPVVLGHDIDSPPGKLASLAGHGEFDPFKHVVEQAILACPACKGNLLFEETRIICPACRKAYPIRDGIPVMLISEAEPWSPTR